MKVLGIVGSPRQGSNTEILVKEALEAAKEAGAETEIINIAHKNIAPCDGCGFCAANSECRIEDDMQLIYSKLLEADGIFIGTPVYMWSVSGQTKVFMDRTFALLQQRKLRGKVGGIAVVAGRVGCGNVYSLLTTFFALQRMTLAGGVIGYADEPGSIKRDKQAMRDARLAGRAVVRTIRQMRR